MGACECAYVCACVCVCVCGGGGGLLNVWYFKQVNREGQREITRTDWAAPVPNYTISSQFSPRH